MATKQEGRKSSSDLKTSSRSSTPRRRGQSTGQSITQSKSRTTSNPKRRPPTTETPTRQEIARIKATQVSMNQSDEGLESMLQQYLQCGEMEQAAWLIHVNPCLSSKYKTSDVVRLLIDMHQFDRVGNLIRDLNLTSNQLLVTLFIKELVRVMFFPSAVRYAEEMVINFGQKEYHDQVRPSWTPQALIQAMIRAQGYKMALKYAKQYDLLDVFPVVSLVASMLECQAWEDAVASILEYRLYREFPLEPLIVQLLQHQQWNGAMKCIQKLSTKQMMMQYMVLLIRECSRMGEFVLARRYMSEYKLDWFASQQEEEDEERVDETIRRELVAYFINCLKQYREWYKAIKYAMKFGLESIETIETMIHQAIVHQQYHVATHFIKKYKLQSLFTTELEEIQAHQQQMKQEFDRFRQAREQACLEPVYQDQLRLLLGDKIIDDVIEQVVENEEIISVEEQVMIRKQEQDEVILENHTSQSRFTFAQNAQSLPPSSFNFDQFASSLSNERVPQQSSMYGQPSSGLYAQAMAQGYGIQPPPPPPLMFNGSEQYPPQPPGYPSTYHGATPTNSFDIASLAMQFHARPMTGPPPPTSFQRNPPVLNSFFTPPMQIGTYAPPPPPPASAFKPSMSYTSVTISKK